MTDRVAQAVDWCVENSAELARHLDKPAPPPALEQMMRAMTPSERLELSPALKAKAAEMRRAH